MEKDIPSTKTFQYDLARKKASHFFGKNKVFFLYVFWTLRILQLKIKNEWVWRFFSLTDSIRQTMEARKKIPVVGRSPGGALSFGQFKTVSFPQVLMNFVDLTIKQKRHVFPSCYDSDAFFSTNFHPTHIAE